MSAFILAWIIGEGIVIWRAIKQYSAPPLPSDLLATSGLFVILAIIAEFQPQLAMMIAWAFDLAAFLYLATAKPTAQCGSGTNDKTKTTPSTKTSSSTTTSPNVKYA
jgi:hypothetical protein